MDTVLLNIKLEDIEDDCASTTTYKRGKTYWKNGQITNFNYDATNGLCKAIVNGNQPYHVLLEADENGHVLGACDCIAFSTYSGFCKHIVAVLLNIYHVQQNNNRSHFQKKQSTEQFIHLLDTYQTKNDLSYPVERYPLHIEYTCTLSTTMVFMKYQARTFFEINIKIGPKRMYVVQDLNGFLKSVILGTTYEFTKHFTYDPNEYTLHPEDLEIIRLLHDMQQHKQFYDHLSMSYSNNVTQQKRSFIVSPLLADQLMPLIIQRNIRFVNTTRITHFVLGIPPYTFHLNKGEGTGYSLSMNQLHKSQFIEPYQYIIDKDTLYKVTQTQFKMLLDMQKELSVQDQLDIQNEQMEEVISRVVPTLNKVGKVEIDPSISDQIKKLPLNIKCHVDMLNDRLTVQLAYHYGDIVIHPLSNQMPEEKDDQTILMRDMTKEDQIMSIIEHTSLKWNGHDMYIDQEDEIYYFLFHSLPELAQMCDMHVTSAIDAMFYADSYIPHTTIEKEPMSNLLEVSFEMDSLDSSEIQNMLQAVVEKKRYHRFADGTFVSLENDEFQNMRNILDGLGIDESSITSDKITVPAIRGLQMEDSFRNSESVVKIGKSFRQLLTHMKHPEDLEFKVPDLLVPILRDYQTFGFQWLKTLAHYHFGGILADDMGLGKTLQSIAFILSEKEKNHQSAIADSPALIVAPSSLIYNWKNECHKFAPDLRVLVVRGDQQERHDILAKMSCADVIVTSYPLIRRDIEQYMERTFSVLFLDEAQAIKNDHTQTAQAVKKLKASRCFALSGTPIENRIEELWSIFQVVLPGLFTGKQAFKNLPQEKVARMVKPFILRRMKKDVLKELPDKIESTQVSELNKEQKQLYIGYLEKIQQETAEGLRTEGFQKQRMKILAGLTRLRQICCHPATFVDNYTGSSSKLEQLLEIVEESMESGRRLLIFSQFTGMLSIIRQALDPQNLDYFYLDGQTDLRERINMAERFNQGEKQIFLISLKAGGTGLNLTGADTVILFDLWWNPAVDEQAVDRAHRIGQKKVVHVIRLLTEGTIEEKIYEMQQKKKALIEKVIQPGEELISSLSEQDIRELLNI